MQEGEDLAGFIEEQRAKLAYDRDRLQNNPPSSITNNSFNRQVRALDKENQMPSDQSAKAQSRFQADRKPMPIQTAVRPPSTPRIFRLGDDYKKRQEKLKEELREDYRNAMAEKNIRTGRRHLAGDDLPIGARSNSDLGLSLPLKDRLSAKERMRLQRNREYNDYLLTKEELERQQRAARSLSRSPVRLAPEATPVTKYFAAPITNATDLSSVSKSSAAHAAVQRQGPSVKDANTETYEELLARKRKQEKSYRGADHEDDVRGKAGPRYRDEPDEGYYSNRRVRFPRKERRSEGRGDRRRRSDDYVDYDEDEDLEYRSHRGRRRGRPKRRERRYDDSEEDSEFDSEEEERAARRRPNASTERRQTIPASYQREETTLSLDAPVTKPNIQIGNVRSRSVPPNDFQQYTGLPVGHVPSANTVQRRKAQYRDELLEQMEANKRQKQKEKELDRITGLAAVEHATAKPGSNVRKSKDASPPKRRAEADQTPKNRKVGKRVPTFSDESSEEEDRPRRSRFAYPPAPYMPQMPPPMPPPQVGYYPSPYPGPYGDPYAFYGARNPLDPNAAYGAPPVTHPGVSPLLAATGILNTGQDVPQRSKKSVKLNVPTRLSQNESSLIADEDRDKERKKLQTIEYQEELRRQIHEKNRQKAAAKNELEQYNMKIEEEARNYNPWGKGGGGAPMKDRQGNLISDLRQMHLENEEVLRDPTKSQQVLQEKLPQTNLYRGDERPVIDLSPRKNEGALSPQFGRSNPFEARFSDEQRNQSNAYKDYLQKQIEEKKRLEAEKKEKERLEDEKEERRLEAQRQRIQAELDAEVEKDRRKKEAAQQKNDELRVQVEEKRKEEQDRKKREDEEVRQQKERELDEKLRKATRSPPVPALRNLPEGDETDRPIPANRTQREGQGRVAHTPNQKVTQRRDTYRVGPTSRDGERPPNTPLKGDSKRISRELSALRKQLRSEQRRVEDALKSNEGPPPKPNNDYLIDLSKARQKPVTVRRPPTVDRDRPDSSALDEFTAYKHRPDDTASIRMFRAEYPESPDDAATLERQQRALLAQQDRKLEDLRTQAVMGGEKVAKRKPERRKPTKAQSSLGPSVAQSRASLLEAETAYIPVRDDDDYATDGRYHYDSNRSSPPQSRQNRRPSARDRRRNNRRAPSSQSGHVPVHRSQSDNFSLNSISSLATLDVDRIANKNSHRLDKLRIIQGDDVSLTDPDDILDRFIKQKGHRPPTGEGARGAGASRYRDYDQSQLDTRPPSVNTLDTEPWLRPETGPTVA